MDIFSLIIAPLIVALVIWIVKDKLFQQTIDAAPEKYVKELEKLIIRGYEEGVEKAVINAVQ